MKDLLDYNPAGGGVSAIVNSRLYDAFGNLELQTGTATTPIGYTGKYFDQATGLQNSWNRWYSPKMGRFISQDPIGFGGGDANLYRYVGNSAANATDPTGTTIVLPDDEAKKLIASLDSHGWKVRTLSQNGLTYITMDQNPKLYSSLQREIVGQMLSSQRRSIEHDTYKGLLHEVYVRLEIVNAANTSRSDFQEGDGSVVFDKDYFVTDKDTGWHSVKEGISPVVALQNAKGSKLGCQMATSWTVTLGIAKGTALAQRNMEYSLQKWTPETKFPHALALEGWTQTVNVFNTNELIPGDWIYFRNVNWTENAGFGPGEQGHNGVYIGGHRSSSWGQWEKFWYTIQVINGWYGHNSGVSGRGVLLTEVDVPHPKIFAEKSR